MRLVKLLLFVFTFQMPLFALTATNCYSTIGNNQLDTIDCSTGLVDNIVTVKPKYKGNTSNLKILSSNVLGYYDVAVPASISLKDYIQCLKATGMYESVEPCIMGKVHDISQSFTEKYSQSNCLSLDASYAQLAETGSFPNDTYYNLQSLDSYINLGDTWSITMGNPNVKMAIIDTGVDCEHPDLGEGSDGYSNIAESLGTNADSVQYYHGTAVAGIIGAKTNNGIGIAGIAGGNNNNGITIIPYNVAGGPNGHIINYNLVRNAILDAVGKGVKLINISLSFNSELYSMPSDLSDALDYAYNHNVTVICESGDSLSNVMQAVRHPGTHDKVITIGATVFGSRAPFSCGGSELDFVLPGYMVWSTDLNQTYSYRFAGTSYATAMASGIVALMLSANPDLSPSQVKAILIDTAIKIPSYTYNNGRCDEVGYGLLDAYAAVLGAYLINISGPDRLCGEEIYTINNFPSEASVSFGTNTGGFWIQKSSNISFDSYNSTTGELSVQQTTPGDGYIKVYYDDHLLATKEFWVGGPKITNFYYTGNTLYVESDGGLRYYWNINGTQFSSLSQKYYPLADGTYNVSVYTTSPNCGAGPTYTTQLHVSGGNMYSLGAISSDHQVTIETVDYSDSPQPLEAMQTMTTKQAAKDVPYELKNAMTGEVSARGEMPAEGGMIDFSRVRSGLYVLTLSPAGRDPETFKISLK